MMSVGLGFIGHGGHFGIDADIKYGKVIDVYLGADVGHPPTFKFTVQQFSLYQYPVSPSDAGL